MDKQLYDAIKQQVPEFNPQVEEGVAVGQVTLAKEYIDRVLRCALSQFPKEFEFVGPSRRCSPEEEWRVVTAERYNRHQHELAPSDIYLVRYNFRWNGRDLKPAYLYLPFVGQAGTMRLRGPTYTVSPVLADVSLSVAKNGIFMPFLRDRVTFNQFPFPVKQDGNFLNTYIVHCPIHRYAIDKAKDSNMRCTLPHYLFCKYGVEETYTRFYQTEVKMIDEADYKPVDWPSDTWLKYESFGQAPKTYSRNDYTKPPIYLMVKASEANEQLNAMAAGFFYTLDNFAYRVRDAEQCRDVRFWRILLGHLISKKGMVSEGKLLNDTEAHLTSLDDYVDSEVQESLRQSGVYVRDIYQLFAYIQDNATDILKNASSGSRYGKRLMVLRYMLRDTVEAIFNLAYQLNSNNRKTFSESEVNQRISKNFNRNLIFRLTKNHGEFNIISTPNDSKILKLTSKVVSQTDATSYGGGYRSPNLDDPVNHLHPSLLETASFSNQPKSDPTGWSHLNPWVHTDSLGTVRKNPDLQPILEKFARKLPK